MTAAIIKTIAERVGVSASTVIRALNSGHIHVRPSWAARAEAIRLLASELGYRPNSAAKALISGRFKSIGLLSDPDLAQASRLSESALQGVMSELSALDLRLVHASMPAAAFESSTAIPHFLREWAVDGVLVTYQRKVPPALAKLIAQRQPATVWINSKRSRDSVRPDDHGAAVSMVQQLVALGHRQLVYLDCVVAREPEPQRHYSRTERIAGFRAAVIAAGIAERICLPAFTASTSMQDWCRGFITAADRPSAVVTYGHHEAFELLYAATSLGLRVPGDLSIVALSGSDYRLSCLLPPEQELGRQAVRMLMRKIAAPSRHQRTLILPFIPGEGLTLGPPSQLA